MRDILDAKPASEVNSTWRNRADLSIAMGALTNSKRPSCFVDGVYPTHLSGGRGVVVTDTNGKSYVDFIGGLGSNILGYGHDEVGAAVADAYRTGATLSLGSELEVRTAEKVKELFPFIDRVRFLKTGSDACAAAAKIARAKTGRDLILSEGYHGHHDMFVSMTPPAIGVAGLHCVWDLAKCRDALKDAAAVIVEPVMLDDSPARREWLKELRAECTKHGTLLIFDEIITGFRFPRMSVSNHWGITPDLICLGKAMANGMPLSVVGGKKEIMECAEYFISTTFAGERCSMAAALKTMTLLQTKYDVNYLWEKGEDFRRKFNDMAHGLVRLDGYATRSAFVAPNDLHKALLWQEACKAGVLLGSSFFFNFAHIGVADAALSTLQDILTRIRTGSVKLEGSMPTTPFAAKVRKQ